jgi:BirA family biotin operon repressor/biotin-[acetyl-CoA-carboxylase] ligase
MCVVGVGLNVLPLDLDELSAGYACLAELGGEVSAPAALMRVAVPLVRALREFEAGGFRGFAARFAARDALGGRQVVTTMADCPTGIAEGVDERGALRVLGADGRRMIVSSGDVSVRPGPDRGGGT